MHVRFCCFDLFKHAWMKTVSRYALIISTISSVTSNWLFAPLQYFQLELSNKFKALENLENMTIEDHCKGIKEFVTSACTTVLGPKKNIHKEWITQESLDKIKKRKELKD